MPDRPPVSNPLHHSSDILMKWNNPCVAVSCSGKCLRVGGNGTSATTSRFLQQDASTALFYESVDSQRKTDPNMENLNSNSILVNVAQRLEVLYIKNNWQHLKNTDKYFFYKKCFIFKSTLENITIWMNVIKNHQTLKTYKSFTTISLICKTLFQHHSSDKSPSLFKGLRLAYSLLIVDITSFTESN